MDSDVDLFLNDVGVQHKMGVDRGIIPEPPVATKWASCNLIVNKLFMGDWCAFDRKPHARTHWVTSTVG